MRATQVRKIRSSVAIAITQLEEEKQNDRYFKRLFRQIKKAYSKMNKDQKTKFNESLVV